MIVLYSGTPGSGKSLHLARYIRDNTFRNRPVISNVIVDKDHLPKRGRENYHYVNTYEISPKKLIEFSENYFDGGFPKEDGITLIIDEAQMIFNSRDYNRNDRREWLEFFQVHRHYGYYIILVSQFDRMLDRQVRCLIEYEYMHRKVQNMGIRGRVLMLCMLSPLSLFCYVKYWYPVKEKIGSEFFRYSKRLSNLYNTYQKF